jgi:mRNA interferase MazF
MKFYWKVFVADLEPTIGSEQGKTRPVLVASNEESNQALLVVNVIPLTSRKERIKIYPNEVLIPKGEANLTGDSIALCYQIRTLDKTRLKKEIGTLESEETKVEIKEALRFQLGL